MHCRMLFLLMATFLLPGCLAESEKKPISVELNQKDQAKMEPISLYIIVGSTRSTPTGLQIAKQVEVMIAKRSDVKAEIVEIESYNLPFYTDAIAPASRQSEPLAPAFKKWSDKISAGDAFIIVSPEYNAGYSSALKNALDGLYKEWNNKPVAIVGYSGGPSGGTSMIAQLRQVFQALQMILVQIDVKISQSWKAFNEKGELVDAAVIETEINKAVDQLLKAHQSK